MPTGIGAGAGVSYIKNQSGSTPPPSWTPADLAPDLIHWLTAGVAASMRKSGGGQASFGDEIKTGVDQSGNGFDGTTLGTGPTYAQDSGNANLPAMNYALANGAYLNNLLLNVPAPCTFVCYARVVTLAAAAGRQEMYADQGSGVLGGGACDIYISNADDTWRTFAGADLTDGVMDTLPHCLIVYVNGASSEMYLDNVLVASGAIGAGDFHTGITIGNRNVDTGPGSSLLGFLYEEFLVDRQLTPTERGQAHAYGQTTWNSV